MKNDWYRTEWKENGDDTITLTVFKNDAWNCCFTSMPDEGLSAFKKRIASDVMKAMGI